MKITNKERREFQPVERSAAEFANGTKFRIKQITINGGCALEQMVTDTWQTINHSSSLEKAWAALRWTAGITFKTERSMGAPETDLLFLKRTHNDDRKPAKQKGATTT